MRRSASTFRHHTITAMPKRIGKFELPNRLVKIEEGATDTYAKFVAEPFETGYGHTIGNSLRRVLLSSIEGAAIASRISRIHENQCMSRPNGWSSYLHGIPLFHSAAPTATVHSPAAAVTKTAAI